jgi:exopolysaccharide production protein ExoZ
VSSTVSAAKEQKVEALQVMRALAALLVVVHHSISGKEWMDTSPLNAFDFGAIGVQVFFVISGYIICRVGSREDFWKFSYSRITRVVPIYWFFTALFLVSKLTVSGFSELPGAGEVAASLLFVPHYSSFRPDQIWPVLIPGWTLNYEMFFYGLFAAGILIGRPAIFSVAAIVASIGLGYLLADAGVLFKFLANPVTLFFVLGVLIAKFEVAIPKRPVFALVGILIWGLSDPAPLDPTLKFLAAYASAGMILLGALSVKGGGASPAMRFLQSLGDASYSLYLSHTIVLAVVYKVLARLNLSGYFEFSIVVCVGLAASIAGGFISYWVIERPLMNFFKSVWRSRARPATA